MTPICAKDHPYSILHAGVEVGIPYPYLRDDSGKETMWLVGPEHGRSFVVGRTPDGKYVISKGNGLSYTEYPFVNTGELGADTWGLLLKQDAIRDFKLGQEVAGLGIKTNQMQYVLRLDVPLNIHGVILYPHLLQYTVECPYRISDAAFMSREQIEEQVKHWPQKQEFNYMNAAEILVNNLRILHTNGILHNALTIQNYTWALELLDFELACSPKHPYEREDYQRHVPDLMPREILYTYQIIIYIASVLREEVSYKWLDGLFLDNNFNIKAFSIGY